MTQASEPLPHAEPLLENRVVVILGGGQTLGLEAARAVSDLRGRVVIAGAEPAAVPGMAELVDQSGGRVYFAPTAPDSAAALTELAEAARDRFGPVDAVVLLPVTISAAPLMDLTPAAWEAGVSANLRRALLAAQAFAPAMLARGAGTLLGVAVPETEAGQAAQAAVHHGLIGFWQALAEEVRPSGVHVVTLVLRPEASPPAAGLAVAHLLANPVLGRSGAPVSMDTVLTGAGFSPAPGADGASRLARAIRLCEQLQAMLLEAEAEFDRLALPMRPLARGSFVSKVGHRPEEVARALTKLGDQLQRMQTSHSLTDTEFQVTFPHFLGLLERLAAYYQPPPAEPAHLAVGPAGSPQSQRRLAERAALVQGLLATLQALHRRTN